MRSGTKFKADYRLRAHPLQSRDYQRRLSVVQRPARPFRTGHESAPSRRLEVRWPSGVVQNLKNVPADSKLRVEEPH